MTQHTARESVAQIVETHTKLRGESTTLFEHMREANLLLHEVLTGAHENMSTIESNLTSRVNEFAEVVNDVTTRSGATGEQISSHVSAFRNETANVLENFDRLVATIRPPWSVARAGGRGGPDQQRPHRRSRQRTARRRSKLWSRPSTRRPRTSISGCNASPHCSTSRWKVPKHAPAKSAG